MITFNPNKKYYYCKKDCARHYNIKLTPTYTIDIKYGGLSQSYNKKLDVEGIVLTMVDKRNSLSSLIEKDVRVHFKDKVYKTTIPRNVKVSEAPSHGKPALIYDTKCSGSLAYIELAKELILKQNNENE